MADIPPNGNADADARTRTVATPPQAAMDPELEVGQRLGRFVIVGQLGKGGMGAVYAAQDPELNRRVAIKLLRLGRVDPTARARLLREAQAMAQLNHPNVVAVYDIGTHGETVFIAMEQVEGVTLKEWVRAKKRSWREILDAFLQAGQGLLAAHRAGFIHRDFKPDNVLVANDGRVRVTDFGVARVLGSEDLEPGSSPSSELKSDALSSPLTVEGAVVGTLAYMAPEQLRGEALDVRTDEFCFCVALHEALYGERPYAREDRELIRKPRPRGHQVPHWLAKALERGLAPSPAARYPTIEGLLAALQADPWPARRRALLAAGALAVVGAAVAIALRVNHRSSPCDSPQTQLANIWDDTVRERMHDAFRSSGAAAGEDRFTYAAKAMDREAGLWRAGLDAVCQARAAGTQSESGVQLQLECLTRQREDFQVVSEMLVAPSPELVKGAVAAVQSLAPPSLCADPRTVPIEDVLPPDKARRANEIRVAAVRAQVEGEIGQSQKAIEEETKLYKEALALPDPALAETIEASAGRQLGHLGDERAALAAHREAQRIADEARIALASAEEEVQIAGELSFFAPQAEFEAAFAAAKRDIERLGNPPHLTRLLELSAGMILNAQGRTPEALPHYQKALELTQEVLGPDSLELLLIYNNLASSADDIGQEEESLANLRKAAELSDRLLGPDSGRLQLVWLNTAWVLQTLGRHAQAEAVAKKAMVGDNSYSAIAQAIYADALADDGQPQEAVAQIAQALAQAEKLGFADTVNGNAILYRAAWVFARAGDQERARQLIRRATSDAAKFIKSDGPDLISLLATAGAVELAIHDAKAAVADFDRVLRVAKPPQYPGRMGKVHYQLARALVESRGDQARAKALIAQALAELTPLPEWQGLVQEIQAFRRATFGD